MAQWSRPDRTVYTKVVYYGPARGGKTTNLRELHRITDPEGRESLLSLATADDRTLFFDLLPLELGSILGYRVAIKLYTVPGQVRYAATRRVVLSGADAVVFVADSSPARGEENRRSFDDLRRNMSANRLDSGAVPILVQLNKRDLPDAVPEAAMAAWFQGSQGIPRPAVALQGSGVLETLIDASKAMLARLVACADERTRREMDRDDLERQIDLAFAPHVARSASRRPRTNAAPVALDPLTLPETDLLDGAVHASMQLGEELVSVRAHAARLEAEADAMRRLSDAVRVAGATFDPCAIVDGALRAAREVLGAACVSLLRSDRSGEIECQASWGRGEDPLMSSEAGRDSARALFSQPGCSLVQPLSEEAPELATSRPFENLRALASAPVEGDVPRRIVAWAEGPDGSFDEEDLRFLATLAAHLAVGLDKARAYGELAGSRDRLEALVRARTSALRGAYENLRALEQTKDRFLANVSHEMRTPLTAILGAASFLSDYEGSGEERREMALAIRHSANALDRLIEGLLRIAQLEQDAAHAPHGEVSVAEIVAEALRLAGSPLASVVVVPDLGPVRGDPVRLARAVANLIENAAKFSPQGRAIEMTVASCTLRLVAESAPAAVFSVLDRGPGIPVDDLERVFAPFEQGGDIMTGKPSGMGLGLYEARSIARRHGGLLRYAPRAGGGSEFRLIVPLVAVAQSCLVAGGASRV